MVGPAIGRVASVAARLVLFSTFKNSFVVAKDILPSTKNRIRSFMSKSKKNSRKDNMRKANSPAWRKPGILIIALVALLATATIAAFVAKRNRVESPPEKNANAASSAASPAAAPATPPSQPAVTPPNESGKEPQTLTMDVNKAVMVTEELDFGGPVPTIEEALKHIERRYKPDDGQGRTFAVLDAYGEPTPDGKLLHISMHVSSEKSGLGELIFKRTGKVLWRSRIMPTTLLPQPKNLTILLDAGNGRTLTVDGSNNPTSVLDAKVKEMGVPVMAIWPDGLEREVIYVHDLDLAAEFTPTCMDGEVVQHRLVSLPELAELIAQDSGVDVVTADASLVILDFLLRRGLLAPDSASYLPLVALRWPVMEPQAR